MMSGPFSTTVHILADGEEFPAQIVFFVGSKGPEIESITVYGQPVDPLRFQEIAEQIDPDELLDTAISSGLTELKRRIG